MLFANSFIFKNQSFEKQSVNKWRKSYQILAVFYCIYAKINSRSAINFNSLVIHAHHTIIHGVSQQQSLLMTDHLKVNLLFNFFFNHINTIFLRVQVLVSGTAKVTENIVPIII